MKNIPHQIHCTALLDTNFYFQVLQLLLLGNWGLLWWDWETEAPGKSQNFKKSFTYAQQLEIKH